MTADNLSFTSLESLWEQFHHPLRNFILKRVEDDSTTDDLLQEVYLKVHAHLHTLRDQERLQAWLYQVARNTIYDYFRRARHETELPETLSMPGDDETTDDLQEKLRQMIRSMIDCLPSEYQAALLQTEYEGLTQKEMAARLGLSVSGAKSRVQRGRDQLRELMLRCCHFQFDRLGQVIDYQSRCQCCDPSCNTSCS